MATETTPPIEDEPLNVPRSYKIRNSTARMLNEIKAAHPDVNVYMNTIVDTALRNYYDFFFSEFTPPTRWMWLALNILVDSGIVSNRKYGKWTRYFLSEVGTQYAKELLNELTTEKPEGNCKCKC